MKKIKNVKEIKPKIKIVKEINKGEEIEELTSEEIPMSDEEAREVSRPIVISSGGPVERIVQENTANPEPVLEEQSGVRLYDVGRGMGSEQEGRAYRLVGEASVQRMADSGSRVVPLQERTTALPDNGSFSEGGLRGEQGVNRDNYEAREKPKKKVGPWE